MLRTAFFRSSCISLIMIFSCQKQEDNSLPYYNTPDFTPQFLSKDEAANRISHRIDPFLFTDQDNKIVTDKTVDRKIHIASFIFTSCGSICPTMIQNLDRVSKKVQKRYRRRFVIFFGNSVD